MLEPWVPPEIFRRRACTADRYASDLRLNERSRLFTITMDGGQLNRNPP